jgi:hypothetical protein
VKTSRFKDKDERIMKEFRLLQAQKDLTKLNAITRDKMKTLIEVIEGI